MCAEAARPADIAIPSEKKAMIDIIPRYLQLRLIQFEAQLQALHDAYGTLYSQRGARLSTSRANPLLP